MNYERIIALLPDYLQRGENLNKILKIIAELYNELFIIFLEVEQSRGIEEAEGAALDIIGDKIVQTRNNMQDEIYRNRLKTKIMQNNSLGYIESINKIAKAFLKQNYLGLRQAYQFKDLKNEPAKVEIVLDGNSITNNATQYDMRYYKTGYKVTGVESLNKVSKQVKKASSLPIFTELEKALAIGVRLQYRIKDTKEVIKISSGIKIIKQSTLECGATGLQAEIGVLL